jgi:hypothetical protein
MLSQGENGMVPHLVGRVNGQEISFLNWAITAEDDIDLCDLGRWQHCSD